jgi:large subunit ribosomal protein L19
MNVIDAIEAKQKKDDVADFEVGDTVRLNVRVIEGAFTVRKVTAGVAVERIFPLHSPNISDIKVVRHGHVRRARLYYLRKLSGKAARIRERRTDHTEE